MYTLYLVGNDNEIVTADFGDKDERDLVEFLVDLSKEDKGKSTFWCAVNDTMRRGAGYVLEDSEICEMYRELFPDEYNEDSAEFYAFSDYIFKQKLSTVKMMKLLQKAAMGEMSIKDFE